MTVVDFIASLALMLMVIAVVLVPVWAVARQRRYMREVNERPPDLRRAGDGQDDNDAAGPGLGEVWPPS